MRFLLVTCGSGPPLTHSTENIGADDFLAVIFEFVDAQGPRVPSIEAATHVCEPGGRDGCVDRTPLFCTDRFCIRPRSEDRAARGSPEEDATSHDWILVAVSDYALTDQATGRDDVVHARRRGEVERVAAGTARRWTGANGTASPDPHYRGVVAADNRGGYHLYPLDDFTSTDGRSGRRRPICAAWPNAGRAGRRGSLQAINSATAKLNLNWQS